MTARFVQGDGGEPALSGQIISVDEFVSAPDRSAIRAGAGQEMIQLVADLLSRNIRTISSVSEELERHLAAQGDDLGSEFAIEIRTSIGDLDQIQRHLRELAAESRIRVSRAEEVVASLRKLVPTIR